MWKRGPAGKLARVTARLADGLDGVVVVAHARLVVTGGNGHRLHEELIAAGASLAGGRYRRLNVGETKAALDAATSEPAPGGVWSRLAGEWSQHEAALRGTIEARARERFESLEATLERRRETDVEGAREVLEELRRSIEVALAEPELEQLALFSPDERSQLERDVEALRGRLAELPAVGEAEAESITARYANPEPRVFPAAISFIVPREGALS